MAKTNPKDTVVSFFQDIKYFKEGKKLIIILPEGLKSFGIKAIKSKEIELKMGIDDLSNLTFIATFEMPEEITVDNIWVLQADDAQIFDK